MERSAGILLHISSLPSKYGIGTLGKEAYAFIDFLKKAKQKYWQLLPLGHTSFGDSPYQSFSVYAGNPYFIDLEMLLDEGLLNYEDLESMYYGDDSRYVDYCSVYYDRYPVLHKAFERGKAQIESEIKAFRAERPWLENYYLFMAIKKHFDMVSWQEWPDENIRQRDPEAVAYYAELLRDDVDFYAFLQMLFFKQWKAFKDYAKRMGIKLIGDVPMYVAMDSADTWASRENFMLDDYGHPNAVAGVPPDYFSEKGQLWGNPLYDWDYHKKNGYGWWMARIRAASELFDVIRIDHFRGLESYWAVPANEITARNGKWEPGPGMEFINCIKRNFPELEIIAEDLGILTDDVRRLLNESGYPGMKVLQFAFDPSESSDYLPHKYSANCVCYTGTHDNNTTVGWMEEIEPKVLENAAEYLKLNDEEGYNWGILRGGMSSAADLFVAPMQDYLGISAEGRMNIPGTIGGNWAWRMLHGETTDALANKIAEMTLKYNR